MDWLPAWVTRENFSLFADILSLIGFVATILVYFSVRNLKNFYILKARTPDLLKKLANHSSKMIDLHKTFQASTIEISLEVERAEVTIKSIKRKVDGEIKPIVKETETAIRKFKEMPVQMHLSAVYNKLQKLILAIQLQQQDRKWEQNV